ncbi:uncharacterized protein Z518_04452 [Rhinocladiella mackenziei CBS 650.93]|uniref:Kinetochore protein Sos7 coiled-coil domain-containing protein n=1 Tax=Rhinocladiella mackenziei CBS 650.93 TaxID=1442369 RepID=A0A0D2ITJ4_9EURO|nr:uncharacterized protein Z518_04452 [Rhinocladiella mackenziei CBS 650.93]KIX06476.1 hypothetical protein Z518_04452 [Rhinocladiella mackenziei CBS 650.93]
MPLVDYSSVLAALRAQQAEQPLSILALAEPIIASQSQSQSQSTSHPQSRPSDTSNSLSQTASDPDPSLLTSASLSADLTHYKNLFSKLRFSYLEQVTKEKYLRSIVGDPPLVVSHDDNLVLEDKLAGMKTELKGKKAEVDALVAEMEETAKLLATSYESVNEGMQTLERVPPEIERLRNEIEKLQSEIVTRRGNHDDGHSPKPSKDPRMNMSLDETEQALAELQSRNEEIDRQIDSLQRQMPGKIRDVERMDRELAELEKKRNESSRLAMEVRRRRELGGRDEMEDLGKWYRDSESVLRCLLDVQS